MVADDDFLVIDPDRDLKPTRAFGMQDPMRRPTWALPIGAAFLALQFVAGFIVGALVALWWVKP